jgi:two-component system, LuxR family, response regulator FixJ
MQAHRHVAVQSDLIVVVDDDDAVRKSLKFSLEVEGYVVRTYARGEELLNEAEFPTCRCLVVDQRLPGISGFDLIANLRRREISVPAILVATHPSVALKKSAAAAGVAIVEKPLLSGALLDGMREAMKLTPPPH